jgi:heptosyltransferase-2
VQKFLVIQTAFIGDAVLATGIVEKLHAFFPDAAIDFLVRKGNEPLFSTHPFLREVLVWDKKQHKLRNLWNMAVRIRRTRYDTVINVQRFAATGFLTVFSGAHRTIGFDKNPFSSWFTRKIPHIVSQLAGQDSHPIPVSGPTLPPVPARHEIERNQDLIKDFTDSTPARPRLYPSQADYEKVQKYKTSPYITISPASVWFTKQYPKEKWISFIKGVAGAGNIYLVGGPSDKSLCETIRESCPGVVDLSGQLSFLQSAALMKDAAMNYVNDSAPLHFASAVNAPVTAVYCSTIPSFGFGPLSDRRFVVEIKEPLDCRPCGLHGYQACPLGHFKCARNIEDSQLLQTLQFK